MSGKCSSCGFAANPDGAHYCGKCGKPLGKERYVVVDDSEYSQLKWSNNYLRDQNYGLQRRLDSTFSSRMRRFFGRFRWSGMPEWVQVGAFILLLAVVAGAFYWGAGYFGSMILPSSSETLEIVEENGRYGLKDTGRLMFRTVLDFDYDRIDAADGCFVLVKSGRYGLAEAGGTVVVEPGFDSIAVINRNVILAYSGDKVGWVNARGKEILPCEYCGIVWEKGIAPDWSFQVPGPYLGNIVQVKRNSGDEWSLYNRKGRKLVQETYVDAVQTGVPDLIKVYDGSGYGLVDSDGKQVLPCGYSSISRFSAERAWCISGGDTALCVNARGEKVFELDSKDIDRFWTFSEEGTIVGRSGLLTYYDRDGNIMIPPKYRYVRNAEGGYYNPSFKNGRAIVHNGSGFGYVDTKGNFTPAPDLK